MTPQRRARSFGRLIRSGGATIDRFRTLRASSRAAIVAALLATFLYGMAIHPNAASDPDDRASLRATLSATAAAPDSDDADGPALAPAQPRLLAAACSWRGCEPPRAPTQRDALAERIATIRPAPCSERLGSATLGVAVPSCLPLLRWSLAHSTATSPA